MLQLWFATQVPSKLERLRIAEKKLLELSAGFTSSGSQCSSSYNVEVFDTDIPRYVVPLKNHGFDVYSKKHYYTIHGIKVESARQRGKDLLPGVSEEKPLVILHGYTNGAVYFYRNLAGLSDYFAKIYSLDLLGWGLSSRPKFRLQDNSVETAENFFVQSLEAWRQANHIDKMILAGHSMGGYIGVAYCERYPQHVDRLILISPVGVPEDSVERKERLEHLRNLSFRARVIFHVWTTLFYWCTVGDLIRMLPADRVRRNVLKYLPQRLPGITDTTEQQALADYFYWNNALPGSGEYCLNRILNPNIMAIRPTQNRIPKLKVRSVSFLYGSTDWMEVTGGLKVQEHCDALRQQRLTLSTTPPDIQVYRVEKAGHLLMLDNWESFNASMILAAGGHPECPKHQLPTLLSPETS